LRRFGGRGASTSSLSWSSAVARGHPVHRCGAVGYRRSSPSVAARGSSPLPPRPSPVAGSVRGVFPRGRVVRTMSARRALLDFAPPSELSFCAGPGPSSPGSVRFRLSTDVGSRVHSRVPSRVPFGRITTMCPVPFRLRGFAPPWRLPPLELRGLVSSRCRSEVHRVSASASLAVGSGPPHGAARTLRRMPLVVSRTASPQPLPPCRLRRSSSLLSPLPFAARSLAPRPFSGSTVVRPRSREVALLPPLVTFAGSPRRGGSPSVPPLHVRPAWGSDTDALPPRGRSGGCPTPSVRRLPRQVVVRRVRGMRSGSGVSRPPGVPGPVSRPRSPAEAGHLGTRWRPSPRMVVCRGLLRVSRGRGPPLAGRVPRRPVRVPSRGRLRGRGGRLRGLAPPTSP
jgi:hypothetical protein